ncbi:carbohydrate ABC transporter permease [Merismopedia glauca]|uniref:Sugar ABC transporter permease n=1 Tax=Merismopedia glauca CCAP 1448/3 TaxID=1296344 RepID=A0A2T1C5Q4_9CYAN|nr:sugar ABC transporter permease [Merismopedia glauca]PSB03467.1 sugar ABC transporter permease [Merismopedia glauca CCAP 1448/3]
MEKNQLFLDKKLSQSLTGYSLILPASIVLLTFAILPLFYAIFLSFHKVKILGDVEYKFIGWKNFIRVLSDERVLIALKNTVEYVIIVVPTQTLLALGLALILNANLKGKNWFRIIFFLPNITSSTVLTLIFMWIYNADGLLNNLLKFLHLPTYNWLGDPNVALKSIMLMNIWSTAPFFAIIYLAALQDIPKYLYEAASIDGVEHWEQFLYITLPALKPVTFFALVMGVIGTFQLFDQAYIFSGGSGGPNNSTLTIVMLIYQYAFKSLDIGYASALALILALVIAIATLLQRLFIQEEKFN